MKPYLLSLSLKIAADSSAKTMKSFMIYLLFGELFLFLDFLSNASIWQKISSIHHFLNLNMFFSFSGDNSLLILVPDLVRYSLRALQWTVSPSSCWREVSTSFSAPWFLLNRRALLQIRHGT